MCIYKIYTNSTGSKKCLHNIFEGKYPCSLKKKSYTTVFKLIIKDQFFLLHEDVLHLACISLMSRILQQNSQRENENKTKRKLAG